MNDQHASDCAVHNPPALPAGPCSCGVEARKRIASASTATLELTGELRLALMRAQECAVNLERQVERWEGMAYNLAALAETEKPDGAAAGATSDAAVKRLRAALKEARAYVRDADHLNPLPYTADLLAIIDAAVEEERRD